MYGKEFCQRDLAHSNANNNLSIICIAFRECDADNQRYVAHLNFPVAWLRILDDFTFDLLPLPRTSSHKANCSETRNAEARKIDRRR